MDEIYEVELVKKGDITYPVVKVHEIPTRDELSKRMQQLSKPIRRLIRISPSIPQRVLNHKKLDYLLLKQIIEKILYLTHM